MITHQAAAPARSSQDKNHSRKNHVHLRIRAALYLSALALLCAGIVQAQTNVTTQHNDISRTGQNINETILTPANVNTTSFGKLFSYTVNGWIYTQPLYMPGVTLGAGTSQAGTTHNVIFIATEGDDVYAFDADSNTGANANPLWHASFLTSAYGVPSGATATTVPNGDVSTGDIVPQIGISSTPVIDPTTNTIYVVGKTKETGNAAGTYIQRLHALDITTGLEKFGGPVALSASVTGTGNGSSGGTLKWDPLWENNRASLLLLNGIVYIGFGSHGDNGPWHGWILAYKASTLGQTGAWCASPNGLAGGIWMGGAGLAADVPDSVNHPFGRMLTATGNGTYDATAPNYSNTMDYGDSIIKLDLSNGVPTMISGTTTVGDDFTPHDQANLNNGDQDQASGGVLLLPDSVSGGIHRLIQLGKTGRIYNLNQDSLGGYNAANTKDPGEAAYVNGLWGSPAYWNGNVYVWSTSNSLMAFSISNGTLSSTFTSESAETAGTYSPTPSVSANGTTNGIVWSLKTDNYGSQGREILYAHSATNVATLLYSSESNVARDNPGNSVKFIVPTIMNGKVYTGSEGQVSVFGVLNGATQAAAPAISPASESFNPTVQVSITDSTSGATIYYTINGTVPTTASTIYTAPFTVSTTETVQAIAGGSGFLQSAVASATYSLVTQVATPTFSPAAGAYTAVQSVTISTTTAGATIYYTLDGTTPTTSSTKYSGPISVGVTETLKAIATAPSLSASTVTSGLYTIDLGGVSSINFGSGFTAGSMVLNGNPTINGTHLRITDGGANEASAAWYGVPANVQSFTNDFNFLITPGTTPTGDGFTFAIQSNNASGVGPLGGGLGYGPDTPGGTTAGIPNSVAIKFDLYSNAGEGVDSTGIYTNGASPTTPFVDMTGTGIDLHSGDPFHVHMTYDGTTLTMIITDSTTNASFTQAWPIDIPGTVGGTAAYVGFTGGTGGSTAIQDIITWTFVSGTATQTPAATPTLSLTAGTYLGTQTVSISDATAGATIFYTTDGTTPATSVTGSTKQYSAALSVTSTQTINAIATASGFSSSAVASAAYTIESQVTAPVFAPAPGSYPAAQPVTITSPTSGATIYYTTNGTTPTTSSTLYTGAVTVSATETIQAIAVASGFFNSTVTSGTYTIGSSVTTVNLGSGFTAGAMLLNGNAALNGTRLRLTDGNANEASSAWYNTPVNIQQFSTNFTFQITGGSSPTADGFTFTIQGGTSTALGPSGGGLGYGPDNVTSPSTSANTPIAKSIAVKFDLYSNAGEGVDSTGLYLNGVSPTTPFVDMSTSTINLHTTDTFNGNLTYNGTNLTLTVTDTVTNGTFTNTWPINIPSTVGANTAYVGFTGGTGGDTAIQDIITWTLSPSAGTAATPTFGPAAGTYLGTQSVTLSDTTTGATIYYTTDGSTPTTSSAKYSSAISVPATETINAIAAATSFANSAVASAKYVIESQVAAPTFTPVAGTYTAAQSVTLSSATSGASIYYTTNGTTPTTSSTLYSGAIAVGASETIEAIAAASGFFNSNVSTGAYVINLPAAATPVISPATGTFTAAQSVTISDTTSGATIYYTIDGSQPTTSSTKYSAAFNVSATTTVKAIAVASGFTTSATAASVITITLPAATPVITPATGTFTAAQSVTITDATSGASIYYTLDGSQPTTASTKYAAAFNVGSTTTVKAIAVATGFSTSATATSVITVNLPAAATPAITPATGTFTSAQSVTITDATSGASIYYTLDGSQPTTSSTKYSAAFNVGSTTTVKAIGVGTGFSTSATTTSVITINLPAAATPVINPATGTFIVAQSVTITDATSGSTVYYTLDGTQPTASSTKFSSAFNVTSTTTVKAIAVASGFTTSAMATSVITISTTASTVVNFGSGFTATGMQFNGHTKLNGTRLQLTDTTTTNEVGSAFWNQLVNVQSFTNDFTFQLTSPTGDGMTFAIQGVAPTQIGPAGGGLGYGPDSPTGTPGLASSVAVKFDLYNNSGEGTNSTGLYTDGASPTTPATTLGGGVNLHSGDVFHVHMTYDGTTLTMTITDTTTPADTFTTSWPVNIPSIVGGNGAYVGFTGGTGGSTATQEILTWSYATSGVVKTPIVYKTSTLTAVSSGPTFRQFTYANFPDTTGTILDATKVGDNVTFTVNVATAGSYSVKVSYKEYNTRGIMQLAINGTNVGTTVDQYLSSDALGATTLGTFNFAAAGNYSFQFIVTAKNAASSGYGISFDDFTLTPQ